MHIVWLILKIILWILLGILGLVLLLLLLILLCPIHYKANIRYLEKAKVTAKIRYLIVTVRIFFDQETKQTDTVVRVLGIRFGRRKKKAAEESDAELPQPELLPVELPETAGTAEAAAGTKTGETADADAGAEPGGTADGMTESAGSFFTLGERIRQAVEEHTPEATEFAQPVEQIPLIEGFPVQYGEVEVPDISPDSSELLDELPELEEDADREAKVGLIAKIIVKLTELFEKLSAKGASLFEKLSDKADAVSDQLDAKSDAFEKKRTELDRTLRRFEKFWNLKCTEKMKAYLGGYLLSVLRHIAPRKAKGYAHYGFEDAAKTGQITGYLSVIPCVYQKGLSIEPDFYEKIMDLDLSLKGHILLGYVLRIIFKINLWKTLLAAKKIKA